VTATSAPGPLADEAAALVEAALAWAQRAASAIGPDEHTCVACPLCRALTALREPDPQLADRLTASVTDLATTVAAGLRMAAGRAHHGFDRAPDEPPPSPPPTGVEHIDIV
jgi:hypothetical protein